MPSDFPFLDSLADEINKVHFETEEQAKQMISRDLTELRARKDEAFGLAKSRIARHKEAIEGMSRGINTIIDKLSNSGERKPEE